MHPSVEEHVGACTFAQERTGVCRTAQECAGSVLEFVATRSGAQDFARMRSRVHVLGYA